MNGTIALGFPRSLRRGARLPRSRRLGHACMLSFLLVLGCSDGSRRMGEKEALDYKRELIQAHRTELSPVQAEKLMYHPGRTRKAIDAYLEELEAEYAAQREAERARWEQAREEAEEASEAEGGEEAAEER